MSEGLRVGLEQGVPSKGSHESPVMKKKKTNLRHCGHCGGELEETRSCSVGRAGELLPVPLVPFSGQEPRKPPDEAYVVVLKSLGLDLPNVSDPLGCVLGFTFRSLTCKHEMIPSCASAG